MIAGTTYARLCELAAERRHLVQQTIRQGQILRPPRVDEIDEFLRGFNLDLVWHFGPGIASLIYRDYGCSWNTEIFMDHRPDSYVTPQGAMWGGAHVSTVSFREGEHLVTRVSRLQGTHYRRLNYGEEQFFTVYADLHRDLHLLHILPPRDNDGNLVDFSESYTQ